MNTFLDLQRNVGFCPRMKIAKHPLEQALCFRYRP